jgi:RNA polymerase sigma-70 factor (ECF subfamily)
VEKDLLTRLKSGDAEAFHALLLESQDRVFSICYRFLQNREDAEDTAQEVFVAIHRSLPEFREEADLKTWMHRIAVTKSLDAIRSKRRKKRRDGVRGILLGTESLESIPTTRPGDPAEILEAGERIRILRQAVASLPRKQRTAIILSRYEGLGNKEISEVMGVTLISVESLVHRANGNLRKRLSRYYQRRFPSGGENGPPG